MRAVGGPAPHCATCAASRGRPRPRRRPRRRDHRPTAPAAALSAPSLVPVDRALAAEPQQQQQDDRHRRRPVAVARSAGPRSARRSCQLPSSLPKIQPGVALPQRSAPAGTLPADQILADAGRGQHEQRRDRERKQPGDVPNQPDSAPEPARPNLARQTPDGRARGATLTRVNGSNINQNARPGEPEVRPPQLKPSSSAASGRTGANGLCWSSCVQRAAGGGRNRRCRRPQPGRPAGDRAAIQAMFPTLHEHATRIAASP